MFRLRLVVPSRCCALVMRWEGEELPRRPVADFAIRGLFGRDLQYNMVLDCIHDGDRVVHRDRRGNIRWTTIDYFHGMQGSYVVGQDVDENDVLVTECYSTAVNGYLHRRLFRSLLWRWRLYRWRSVIIAKLRQSSSSLPAGLDVFIAWLY